MDLSSQNHASARGGQRAGGRTVVLRINPDHAVSAFAWGQMASLKRETGATSEQIIRMAYESGHLVGATEASLPDLIAHLDRLTT